MKILGRRFVKVVGSGESAGAKMGGFLFNRGHAASELNLINKIFDDVLQNEKQ